MLSPHLSVATHCIVRFPTPKGDLPILSLSARVTFRPSRWVTFRLTNTFTFDGVDDTVEIPFSPTLISPSFSVEGWVTPLSQVGDPINQELIFGQSSGTYHLVVKPGTTGLKVQWGFKAPDGRFTYLVSNTEIPIGSFSHLAGTWDGTTLGLYINGVLDVQLGPGKTPTSSVSCPFSLGGFGVRSQSEGCPGNIGGQFFNGVIDELKLHNVALTPLQATTIFKMGDVG